jgi:hypothetical protein
LFFVLSAVPRPLSQPGVDTLVVRAFSIALETTATNNFYHPDLLPAESIITSPGNSFRYEIVGPICRLYDLNELPYPCCRISWRGKEPSWNRQGRRFVPDISTRKHASYRVRLLSAPNPLSANELDLTLFWQSPLSGDAQQWWSKNRQPINEGVYL